MTAFQHDPDGRRLPIKLDTTTNGEYAPIALEPRNVEANARAQQAADTQAKRHNVSRRHFMVSSCGVASSLLAINAANAAAGKTGGFFALAPGAADEPELADDALAGQEFIFDVQGHYVRPGGAKSLKAGCAAASEVLTDDYMQCIGASAFIKDVFLDADTDMMVLSFVPSTPQDEPLTIEEADATRRILEDVAPAHRLLLHGRANPNQPADLERMPALVANYPIAAWKCYTQWGPDGEGFYLDDATGRELIEKSLALGVNNIAIHKGIPFGRRSYEHSLCRDVGVVAKDYPEMNFLIYHSGWIPGEAEGAYDPERGEGVDGLIKSVLDAELGHGSNVYAELGSTWRGLMRDVDSAAHTIGKLVKYLGEDNVLWGTDSVWYGSPQDQIQAFRTFAISDALAESHGYQPMTDALRAKIFGLNALKPYGISLAEARRRAGVDDIAQRRQDYRQAPDPHFLTRGPRNRREFLALQTAHGNQP